VREGAELGHRDQQGERGGGADAGSAQEDLEAGLQDRVGGKLGVQGGIDRGDPAVDLPKALLGLTPEQGQAVGVAAVLGGDAVLDQGAARDLQLLQGIEGGA
jgi:hypothetical protein